MPRPRSASWTASARRALLEENDLLQGNFRSSRHAEHRDRIRAAKQLGEEHLVGGRNELLFNEPLLNELLLNEPLNELFFNELLAEDCDDQLADELLLDELLLDELLLDELLLDEAPSPL